MENIGLHISHDSSICINPAEGFYRVYELERLLNERYCKVNDSKEKLSASLGQLKEVIKKEYKEDNFKNCFHIGKLSDEYKNVVSDIFGCQDFQFISHHLSHAHNTFYQSDFDKSLILSFDGGGLDSDGVSFFNIFIADRKTGNIEKIKKVNIDFGSSYSMLAYPISEIKKTNFLAFAGKIMGLAAYGKIRYDLIGPLREFYQNMRFDGSLRPLESLNKKVNLNLNVDALSGQDSYDLAYTSQYVFEDLCLEILEPFLKEYDYPVCVTGGCALNVLFNQKLKELLDGRSIFVSPNPNDGGLSLGNLFYANPPKEKVSVAYNNFDILDRRQFEKYKTEYEAKKVSNKYIAQLISEKNIIGIMNGLSECGPRALGNRSILCDPSFEDMKDTLNEKVKFREWFRPFAPVVKKENVSDYFHFEGESPFMSFAPLVKNEYREKFPSITHQDGTARVQTVKEEENHFLYDLLNEFEKIKGDPVLLNTSFNIKGKPILTTIEDALHILESTDIDYVIIENYLFKKKK